VDVLRKADGLLGDESLNRQMAAASARLRARPGMLRAADLIEEVAGV
jgi:hypothetical protein